MEILNHKIPSFNKNPNSWSEVIRLYSGLFETNGEREEFIIDLSKSDILLAAECKTSSLNEERALTTNIVRCITSNKPNDDYRLAKSLLALVELKEMETLRDLLFKYKPQRGALPKILSVIQSNFDIDLFIAFYSVIVSLPHRISTKEKRTIRNTLKSLQDQKRDIYHYINSLIYAASPSNITELREIASEIPYKFSPVEKDERVIAAVRKLIKDNKPLSIKQALTLIKENNLGEIFEPATLIKKLLSFKSSFAEKHAKNFIAKFNLSNDFSEFI